MWAGCKDFLVPSAFPYKSSSDVKQYARPLVFLDDGLDASWGKSSVEQSN